MARSTKRSPFHAVTTAVSEALDKKRWAKSYRQSLKLTDEHIPARRRNDRDGRKDGKLRFDPSKHPDLLRK